MTISDLKAMYDYYDGLRLEANQIREAYKEGLINKLEYEDQHEDYFIEKYILDNDFIRKL